MINIEEQARFFLAAKSGNLEGIKDFKEKGGDTSLSEEQALRWASQYNRLGIVQYLLHHGADVNAAGGEALQYAIFNNHQEIFKALVSGGAIVTPHNVMEILSSPQLMEWHEQWKVHSNHRRNEIKLEGVPLSFGLKPMRKVEGN